MTQAGFAQQRLVCVTGPESTGKSTLSWQLAVSLGAVWVPELARALLPRLMKEGAYSLADVERIADAQQAAEQSAFAAGHRLIVADTDLTVIAVWCDVRFGRVPDSVLRGLDSAAPRLTLLSAPDLPWQADELRENPHDRAELFERYEKLLDSLGWRYHAVTGSGESRTSQALEYVKDELR